MSNAKLYAAMAKAFHEVEGASKGKLNPHFKSKYADLESVVAAIKPALAAHELWFRQITHRADGGIEVETFICHSSGEEVSCGNLFMPANKNDAQGYGSALSYCRRYSLMTAFGVCPEDDDGNAAVAAPVRREEPIADEGYTGARGGKMKLKARADAFYRDLCGCGDQDMLDALLNSGEVQDLKSELEQYWIGYLTGQGMTPDWEPINALVRRLKKELPEASDVTRDVNPLGAG